MCIKHQESYNSYISRTLLASLDEMVQTATNTLHNKTGEGGQGPGKGEKERDKVCPDAGGPPGKPYGRPQVLKRQGMRQMPNL